MPKLISAGPNVISAGLTEDEQRHCYELPTPRPQQPERAPPDVGRVAQVFVVLVGCVCGDVDVFGLRGHRATSWPSETSASTRR